MKTSKFYYDEYGHIQKCIPYPKKVDHTDMATLPKIIAVDFDGTLVSDKFPDIGEKNSVVFCQVKGLQNMGWKVILWTCRCNDKNGDQLDEAVAYCNIHGLCFDAVNKNIPEVIEMFGGDTRKVYADKYLDDKNLGYYWGKE